MTGKELSALGNRLRDEASALFVDTASGSYAVYRAIWDAADSVDALAAKRLLEELRASS